MTECSFAMVSRDIMLAVYNDLISIKYVHLMGGSEEDDDPVETFANRYFPT